MRPINVDCREILLRFTFKNSSYHFPRITTSKFDRFAKSTFLSKILSNTTYSETKIFHSETKNLSNSKLKFDIVVVDLSHQAIQQPLIYANLIFNKANLKYSSDRQT